MDLQNEKEYKSKMLDASIKELAKTFKMSHKSLMCTKCPSRIKRQSTQKKTSKAYMIVNLEE